MTVGRLPSIEGGIQPTLVTTTGDMIYASAASNPARLAIGSTGQVLTVASGIPSWATASGEKSILVPKDAGRYIKPFTTVGLSGFSVVEDTTYYFPIYLPNYALDRISCRTDATHTGTSTVRLGLYNADATTGKPSTVYLDAGTVACTAASTNFEITISNTPPAGYYYVAINAQTITGTSNFASTVAANTLPYYFLNTTATVNTTTYLTGYTEASITGAFATAGTLSASTSNYILVPLRMA